VHITQIQYYCLRWKLYILGTMTQLPPWPHPWWGPWPNCLCGHAHGVVAVA